MLPRKTVTGVRAAAGPYRKPTQVVGCESTEALERLTVKELGKLTP